jgi:mannose-6-phosphate isomerase-like protein (cupin superfamily)
MHYVGKVDESTFIVPADYDQHSEGYERLTLIDASVGSVHMGLGICRLQPDGHVEPCVQANEKGIYILEGKVELNRGGEAFRLSANDYALVPYGIAHALRNRGAQAARWLEMQAPQPKAQDGWQDTFFVGEVSWPGEVVAPDLSDPRTRLLGHFDVEMLMPAKRPGVRGLSVSNFMNQAFGAQNFLLMRGEISVGGVVGLHDHPIEESYLFLSGEVDMEIEGKPYHFNAGDFAWTGVGAGHAFFQKGKEPVRWIETQAPQFPAQNGFRVYAAWDKLRDLHKG